MRAECSRVWRWLAAAGNLASINYPPICSCPSPPCRPKPPPCLAAAALPSRLIRQAQVAYRQTNTASDQRPIGSLISAGRRGWSAEQRGENGVPTPPANDTAPPAADNRDKDRPGPGKPDAAARIKHTAAQSAVCEGAGRRLGAKTRHAVIQTVGQVSARPTLSPPRYCRTTRGWRSGNGRYVPNNFLQYGSESSFALSASSLCISALAIGSLSFQL